jgi:palmitoyl-protein thioesterase
MRLVLVAALAALAASSAEGARGLLQPPDPDPSRHAPTPIVMWHGMGDNCCDPVSMGHLKGVMESHTPGLYVHNVMVGPNPWVDSMEGFFGDVNHQVKEQCERLLAEPRLANGFFAVGFSQGSQFMRAVVERCGGGETPGDGKLVVRRLVTLGGQHAGVSALPGCEPFDGNATLSAYCRAAEAAVEAAAYSFLTRATVVQAQYYRDPTKFREYLEKNPFLPDVNNERETKNENYKRNILRLERLVLIRFSEDTVVVPKDSAWFGAYREGTRPEQDDVVELRDGALYKEDWLGLRALDESGRLVMFDCPGQHMAFGVDWFIGNVMEPHLLDVGPEVAGDRVATQ